MIYIKAFICALIILALLVSGFVINYMIIKEKAQILTQKTEALKNAIITEDTTKINSAYEDTLSHWKNHNRYMLMFSNHSNLDSISMSMTVIREKIKARNFEDAKTEAELILATLSSIAQNETLRLENIF